MSARIKLTLVAFLGVAAILLLYEHRVHVWTGPGILIGLLALCVGMHLFMHRQQGDKPDHDRGEPRDLGDNR